MNLVINLCVAKRGALSVMLRQNALLLHRRIFFSTLLPARAKTMLLPTYKAPPFTSQCGRAMKRTILLQSQYFSTKGRKKSKCNSSSDLSGDENLSEKEIALREALSQISASFGKESVMWLGRFTGTRSVPVISTGSVNLDMALGIGGLPKGRVVEIYGPEASGKTTLALHAIAEAQRSGGYCAFIDAEHALDPSLAEGIGVNTKNLLLSQPDYGEQALSIVDTLVRSGTIDVIVVDSVAALVPRTELEGEMGDSHIALQARLMSQALRKLTPSLARSQTLLIFTNQVRHKLSTFGGSFGGPTEVTAGGNALKFYASVRLNIRRLGQVKKGEEVVGSQVQVKIVKNKLAPPFKTADFEIEFGRGISRETEVIELGCKHGLVKKSGGWIWINSMDVDGKEGPKLHGKEGAKLYLKENVDVQNDLISKIKDKFLKSLAGEENLDEEESGADSPEDLSASEKTEMVKVIGEV